MAVPALTLRALALRALHRLWRQGQTTWHRQWQQGLVRLGREELRPFLSKKNHAFVLHYAPAALERAVCIPQMGDLARFVSAGVAAGAGRGTGAPGPGGGDPTPPGPDGAVHWEDVQHGDAVLLLNDASFDAVLRQSQHLLVFFYAPWCLHCSNVKHAYAEAANELAKDGLQGYLAAVDFSSNPLIEKRFRLEFLPAFKLFSKREFQEDHHKLRTKDDFIRLIMKVAKKT